jgi:hypothetical protein
MARAAKWPTWPRTSRSAPASRTLGAGFSLAASASTAASHTRGEQTLTSVGDVVSSAYAVAMTKQGLFNSRDLLRFSFTQPMHVERGALAFNSVEVVDRDTGAIGVVSRAFDIAAPRRHVAESLYATPVLDGQGELSVFGKAQFQGSQVDPELTFGAGFNVRF